MSTGMDDFKQWHENVSYLLTHIFAMVVDSKNKVKDKGQDHQGGRTTREDQHMVQVVKNDRLQKELFVLYVHLYSGLVVYKTFPEAQQT